MSQIYPNIDKIWLDFSQIYPNIDEIWLDFSQIYQILIKSVVLSGVSVVLSEYRIRAYFDLGIGKSVVLSGVSYYPVSY